MVSAFSEIKCVDFSSAWAKDPAFLILETDGVGYGHFCPPRYKEVGQSYFNMAHFRHGRRYSDQTFTQI